MMPVEEAIVEKLWENGPCFLDDIVTSIPNSSWGIIFAALIGCRGTGGCCFTNAVTRPIRSHSAPMLPIQFNV